MTTQNDRKRSRNPMEMVSDDTFQTFRTILVIWGTFQPFLANFGLKLKMVVNWSCDHSKWPQEKQKSNGDGLRCHFSDIQFNFGHLGPFWPLLANLGPKLKNVYIVRNDIDVLKVTSETTFIRFLLVLQSFWGVTRPVCDNFMFGPKNGSFWPQYDTK